LSGTIISNTRACTLFKFRVSMICNDRLAKQVGIPNAAHEIGNDVVGAGDAVESHLIAGGLELGQ
jgi:hypothetical protein